MSHPLQDRVRSIERRARRLGALYGVMAFLAVVVAAVFVVGLSDYFFRYQDIGWRLLATGLVGVSLLGAFVRFVYPVTGYRASDVRVAQRIERSFPQLSDQLSTAVAFLEQPVVDACHGSPALRDASIAAAAQVTADVPLEECLDRRAPRRAVAGFAAVALVVALVAAFDLSATSLALRRVLLPLSKESWPRRNVLVLAKQPQRLAVGADFEVEVIDQNGRLPPRVMFEYGPLGKAASEVRARPMRPLGDRMVLRLENVTESFRYRAVGGDDDTMDWQLLEVVEPPRIGELRVRLFPPDYLQLPAESSGRHIRAWAGTRVTMAGRVDKPVKSVILVVERLGDRHRRRAAVARDGLSFGLPASPSDPWVLDASATYHFELRDRNDFVAADLVGSELHVQQDAPPTVSLAFPNSGAYFTPEALVPIRAIAKDDVAIRSIELEYGEQRRELFRAVDAAVDAKSPVAAPPKLGETCVVEYAWNLAGLPQLRPGDVVEFRLAVSDRRPQYGYTSPTRLLIISADELEIRIDQRQAGLSQKLREALQIQRSARGQLQSLEVQLRENPILSPLTADQLQNVELGQRRVEQVLSGSQDSAAALVGLLLDEIRSNRIERPELLERLTNLQQGIADISQTLVPRILFDVNRVLKQTRNVLAAVEAADGSPADRTAAPATATAELLAPLTTAVEGQAAVIARLEDLLDTLEKWADYRRLAQDIGGIRRAQQTIAEETRSLSTTGQDLASLNASQRAGLQDLSQRQLDLAREFDRLRGRLRPPDVPSGELSPHDSATIAEALETIRQLNLSGQMRQSAEHLEGNRTGQATQLQQQVVNGLQQLLDVFSQRPGADPQRPASEGADVQQRLSRLRQDVTDWTARQQSLMTATESLDREPTETGLSATERQQQQLADELANQGAEPSLAATFRLGIQHAERPMREAEERLRQGFTGEATRAAQTLAVRRLEMLAGSLDVKPEPATPPASQAETTAMTESSSPEPRRRLSLSEIVLLRSMQIDLNQRTAELQDAVVAAPSLSDSEQQAFAELAAEQAALSTILESLTAPDAPESSPKPTTAPPSPDDELDRALQEAGIPGFSNP